MKEYANLLFMDEHKGRQVAKKLGIAITGTVGILLQAFDEQYMTVSDAEECLMILNVKIPLKRRQALVLSPF